MTRCNTPPRMLIAMIAASAAGLSIDSLARTPQPDPPNPGISLTDQISLARLVDLAAERLSVDIEYNAADLGGVVTARLGAGAISDDELWQFVNRALSARGLTTVRTSAGRRGLSVVKLDAASGLSRVEMAEAPRDEGPAPGYRTVLVRCRRRSPKDLAESVRLLIAKPSGTVAEVPSGGGVLIPPGGGGGGGGGGGDAGEGGGDVSGLLLISDLAPRVEQALQLLEILDGRAERAVVEEIPIRNLSGLQMAALVAQVVVEQAAAGARKPTGKVIPSPSGSSVLVVGPEGQAARWRELVQQLDARQPTEVATYSPRNFGVREVAALIEQSIRDAGSQPEDRFKVVADQLTGSLIVTATPVQHERIRALIDRLDAAPQAARRPVRTFAVRNRPVQEIVEILERLITLGVIDAQQPGRGDLRAGPGAASPVESPGKETALNSGGSAAALPPPLPLTSLPRRGETSGGAAVGGAGVSASGSGGGSASGELLSLTADPQTNTLIAIGEPRALTQLEGLLSTLDVRQPQVMLEVLLVSLSDSDQIDLGIELERLTNSGDAGIRLSSLFGLSTTGSAGTRRVGADQAGGTVSVISPAEFSIVLTALQSLNSARGLTLPRLLVSNNQKGQFRSNTQQPVQTIATGSNQITTTAFGGYEQAGTTVTVQPQIAEGDHLRLKYAISLSAFGSGGSAGLPPPRTENTLESEATIPDAYTVVVGGIDVTSETKGTSQIPFLGDIPLIGEAFKNRNNRESRSRFYAFIRAEVLRSTQFDDLKHVSSGASDAAAIDDGFPTVEPRVIR